MSAKKIITVVTAILESVCVGNIMLGWGPMDYMLSIVGYFGSGCNSTSLSIRQNGSLPSDLCASQEYYLGLVFTLSVALGSAGSVIGGVLIDRYGTLLTRNLGTFLFTICCFAIAVSTPQTSWILFPATTGIVTSGCFIYVSNFQTANLFPKYRGTILNILNGSIFASVVVFTAAKSAFENGVSLLVIFIVLGFFCIPILMRTYFLMPKSIFPYDMPNNYTYGINKNCCGKTITTESEHLLQESGHSDNNANFNNEESHIDISLKSCLLNMTYILATFSSVLQWLRVNFFAESLKLWLQFLLSQNNYLVSVDISTFGYIQLSALVFAPLNGAIFDLLHQYFSRCAPLTSTQVRLKGLFIIYLVSSFSLIFYSAFTLVSNSYLQYVTFVLVVIASAFGSANYSLLLISCFPMKHFGTLYTVMLFILAVVTSLQYLLFYIGIHYFNGDFLMVNIILFITAIATLANPFNLYIKSRSPYFNV